jgi:spectinomycin phosphotransferase
MTKTIELIIHCLRACYGLETATLELLSLGADRNVSVYKAESADHKVYFVKIRRGPFSEAHVEVMTLLQQAGVKEIISPIRTREGKQAQQVNGFTLIVYPFIEGRNGFNCSLSDQQWIQLGKILRRIHEIKVPKTVQKHIRIENFSSKWSDAVRSLCNQIDGESDEVGTEFREFLKERKEVIERLLDRAERLSKKLEAQSFPFVLCHSDLHAGNLLLEKGDAFYLIDWDDPIMAPKERDLMFIGGGVGNVWNRPHEEVLFYEGYGKTELNQILLAYYRHERILEDVVEYIEELFMKNRNSKDRAEMYRQFVAMFEPHGVVDIALQVDEKILN